MADSREFLTLGTCEPGKSTVKDPMGQRTSALDSILTRETRPSFLRLGIGREGATSTGIRSVRVCRQAFATPRVVVAPVKYTPDDRQDSYPSTGLALVVGSPTNLVVENSNSS